MSRCSTKQLQKSRLQYFQYYPSGIVGSGLFVASAYPFGRIGFHRFTTAGPWYRFDEGDFWAGKGVAFAEIILPKTGSLCFFNTHVQAGPRNKIKKQQIAEMSNYIQQCCLPQQPAIAAGDFNISYNKEPFAELAAISQHMNSHQDNDTILAINKPAYSYELVNAEILERQAQLKGSIITVSDHTGVLADIRIIKNILK